MPEKLELTAHLNYDSQKVSASTFAEILARKWEPSEMVISMPGFLAGLAGSKVIRVFGSGSNKYQNPSADGNPDRGQIGGMDVYREAEPEDGVKWNKDWYTLVKDPDNPDMLLLVGPKRDAEHWINDLPERLRGS